jgi:hypothetical protein
MRIGFVLVVCAPEEGPNATRALNCAIGQVHCFYHGPVHAVLDTDVMRAEGIWICRIQLEAS